MGTAATIGGSGRLEAHERAPSPSGGTAPALAVDVLPRPPPAPSRRRRLWVSACPRAEQNQAAVGRPVGRSRLWSSQRSTWSLAASTSAACHVRPPQPRHV
jgi:hypothetical protein